MPNATYGQFYYYDASVIFEGAATLYNLVTGTMGSGIAFNDTTCVFSGNVTSADDLVGISLTAQDADSVSQTSNLSTLTIDTSLSAPIWIEPVVINSTVGDFVNIPLINFIANPTPETVITLTSAADTLQLNLNVINSYLIGTVAELQGGTLAPTFTATNLIDATPTVAVIPSPQV